MLTTLTSCKDKLKEDLVTEEPIKAEPFFLVNKITHDTIITGKSYPFERNVVSNPRGKELIQEKGYPLGVEKFELVSYQGIISDRNSTVFRKDSSLNMSPAVTDTLPPREVRVEPIISSVIEPQRKSVLPPIYKDNAQYDIRYLSVDQGLTSNSINDLVKGPDGFLWIATDKGLIKYDGHFTKTYDASSGLPENHIKCLAFDLENNLWVGTRNSGFIKYDGKVFTHYPTDSIAADRNIHFITFDQNNDLWATIQFGGIVRFDGTIFYCYQKDQGILVERPTTSIAVDTDNTKWITGFGVGLYSIASDGEVRRYQEHAANARSSYINKVIIDDNGDKIFAHWNTNFSVVHGDSATLYKIDSVLKCELITDIAIDHSGNYWLCGYGAGLYKWSPTTSAVQFFGEDQGLSSRHVASIFIDEQDGIWLGTGDGGICYLNPHSFHTINKYSGFEDHFVYEVVEHSPGVYYYATNKGIVKHDSTGMTYFIEYLVSGKSRTIRKSCPDLVMCPNNTLWASTMNSGTTRITNDQLGLRIDHGTSAPHNPTCLDTSSDGHIWMCGMNADLVEIGDSVFRFHSYEQGLFINYLTDLLITDDDVIWIGSQGEGLARITGDSIMYFSTNEGLRSNVILHIGEDNQKRIWICTEEGLHFIEGDQVRTVESSDFDFHLNFKSILQDHEDRYWIPTDEGLIVLVPKQPLGDIWEINQFSIHFFDKGNGLSNISFLDNSIFLDSRNRLMIGSTGGLVIRDLDDVRFNENLPSVYLQTIRINGQFVDYRNVDNTTDLELDNLQAENIVEFRNYPERLELPHDLNHLTFEFSALHWPDAEHLTFYYYLEGYEENWNQDNKNHVADYRNLSYGDYIFHLKAVSRDGLESAPFSYSFVIARPWWHTWWARGEFLAVFVLIILALIKWRTAELRRRQKVLESEIKQATEKIRNQKELVEAEKEKVERAHQDLNTKNQEILDSINYAKRIQNAILPSDKMIKEHLGDSFILYQPKDIVAGDFYWLEPLPDRVLLAAADCTGHGVPGAMVSVICNNGLNRAVREFSLTDPGEILDKTRELVIAEFKKSEEGVKDGMDIALVSLTRNVRTEREDDETHYHSASHSVLTYAGANNPLWLIRKGTDTIEEVKADKQPIGVFDNPSPYTTHELRLDKGDCVYLFSDGYIDQFGGEKGKKLKAANFKKLILSIKDLPMAEQLTSIKEEFEKWKGEFEQLDDVCVIGFKC